MKNPSATYRIQLSAEFPFAQLETIIPYLEDLGISTIYAAPFFRSRRGSTHGYDVVDAGSINPEIGDLDTFRKIRKSLKKRNMTWLQDIVPNHMAFDPQNRWLNSILELGPASPYYRFFDINWKDQGKLMTPFFGDHLEEVLDRKELQLSLEKDGVYLVYYDQQYPISATSWENLLTAAEWDSWKDRFSQAPMSSSKWSEVKGSFLQALEEDPHLEQSLKAVVEDFNASKDRLKALLEGQYFLPVHWKTTESKINYRRFFTINDLICLRMEDPEVFEQYHQFIFELCQDQLIQGLRIDHIDGLFDPQAYLEALRKQLGPDFYIVIEKILEWDERLPSHWPVQGTSGYGFLALVNQVFTDEKNESVFSDAYFHINPENADYVSLVYQQKRFILEKRMGGEYQNLWDLGRELGLLEDKAGVKKAFGGFLAAFPVYRIYPEEFPLKKKQKQIIEAAYQKAVQQMPDQEEVLIELKKLFMGILPKDKKNMLYFLQRCQQFTGPLAAKGVEDTSFYIFNKLISHNEVGDSPENFGLSPKGFHDRMIRRKENFPLSINATATHDTKRGEDARMRINVLSEMGSEWFKMVQQWHGIGDELRNGSAIPDANEEYFIFQVLVGAWEEGEPDDAAFLERMNPYLEKVLREAKVHSSWAEPDQEYEKAVLDFTKALLHHETFRETFSDFHQKTAAYGALKSLSQCVLKVTAPGVPDLYQGSELWDLSFVDPDNRRPVDYRLRKEYLDDIRSFEVENTRNELVALKNDLSSGKIKLYCLYKVLQLRREIPLLFEKGEYLPVTLSGSAAESCLGFLRRFEQDCVLVVVPLMVTEIFETSLQLKETLEGQELLSLPEQFPEVWKNVYTQEMLNTRSFSMGDLFRDFPVAVLKNQISA